jgi:hypothetical protein
MGGVEQSVACKMANKGVFTIDLDVCEGWFEAHLRGREDVEVPASGIGFHQNHFQLEESAFTLSAEGMALSARC